MHSPSGAAPGQQLRGARAVPGAAACSGTSAALLHEGDALDAYPLWPTPAAIVSDGPYGIAGYPGDPPDPSALPALYEPHAAAWRAAATPRTTLWFWSTEIGWALTHPVLARHGRIALDRVRSLRLGTLRTRPRDKPVQRPAGFAEPC